MAYNLLLPIILCLSFHLGAQSYPQFESPVKHRIALSGSFGELRTGHFHAGIDIKSKFGMAGDSIFSIEAGYVSRIKVEPGGYGYSLYINHPSGFTSVYAHLKEYEPSIQEYIFQIQSEENCFTIDHTPPVEAFPLAKGHYIGQMGNTGKSFGAHLHFEIRRTSTDKLINPILFGIKPSDNKSPVIRSLSVYELDSLHNIVKEMTYDVYRTNSNEFHLRDTVKIKEEHSIDIAVEIFDRMNGSINKNGIYNLKLIVDQSLIQDYCFDTMDFNDSNGIDYFLDKKLKASDNRNYYNLSIHSKSYPFSFAKLDSLHDDEPLKSIKIQASDYENNISTLHINLSKEISRPSLKTNLSNYIVNKQTPTIIQLQNFDIVFTNNSFYSKQSIYAKEIKPNVLENRVDNHMLILGPSHVKVHNPLTINYKSSFPLNEKFCLVNLTKKGEFELLDNCARDSICTTAVSSLKNVKLIKDTIPPQIIPLFTKSNFKKNTTISFKIIDNIIPKSKKHLLKYRATLNGQWILFNYDLKSNIISHKVVDSTKKGNYFLELQLTDNQDNTSCYYKHITIN